ncbi:EamA family transporter [Kyrpidia spormannii]|uniref:EamA family transporter n=1 Tax=Kyrpidia spormannii TaxID=2055160 RepID=A0A2K8N742_9BACL|nr:DMT family transporter [Kyrpidia spormannii]ATY85113.1 EamA family transporter [Kyrpidia spormannii]
MSHSSMSYSSVHRRHNWAAVVAVVVTLAFWSSAFAGIRAALLSGYSPGHVVLLRFLSASAVFVGYALVRGVQVPRGRDLLAVAALGWTGISIYHIALTFGELTVDAGTASLLIAAAPAFTAVIAVIALGERLNGIGWLGVLVGFGGVALMTVGSGGGHRVTAGAWLILLSAVATAIFFVGQKPLFARYGAIDLTAWFTWFGTLPMLWFAPGLREAMAHAPGAATWVCVYIGVFPAAVAYVAWAIALKSAPAGLVASSLYLNPLLAILIGWVWLGELPGVWSTLGGVIAVAGVVMVNVAGAVRRQRVRADAGSAPTAGSGQG